MLPIVTAGESDGARHQVRHPAYREQPDSDELPGSGKVDMIAFRTKDDIGDYLEGLGIGVYLINEGKSMNGVPYLNLIGTYLTAGGEITAYAYLRKYSIGYALGISKGGDREMGLNFGAPISAPFYLFAIASRAGPTPA